MHNYELAFRLATVFFLLVQSIGPATQEAFVPLVRALAGNPAALVALQATETETLTPYGPETPTDTPTFTQTYTPISSPMPTDTPVYTVSLSPAGTDTETPSLTETPTDIGTTTATGTETETPTPTGTETETPTPTGTQTITPTGTVIPGLELVLQAQMKEAKPGSIVQFEWQVTGLRKLTSLDGLEMLIQVPKGFFPASSKKVPDLFGAKGIETDEATQVFMLDGTFDANTGIYRMALAVEKPRQEIEAEGAEKDEKGNGNGNGNGRDILFGKTAWLIDWQAEGPFLIHAELQQAGSGIAGAELTLDDGGLVMVPAAGGKVEDSNNRVEVEFPGGVLTSDVRVRIRPAKDDSNRRKPLGGGGGAVEILAYGGEKSEKITQFDAPFAIRFAFDPSLARLADEFLQIVYWDEEKGDWVGVPTEVDREHFILSAQVDHLTVFDYTTANFDISRLPNLDGFQVNQFTGAGTYSYPLVFPGGPGGLQPSASIDYNSQNADNANSNQQGGLLGMGWDLSFGGAIERNWNGALDRFHDDSFSITAGGVGGMLVPGADGYYHTTNENFWRIQFNSGNNTWTAYEKTGSVYTFEPIGGYPSIITPGQCELAGITWYWGLTSIKNNFGREITFTYYTESRNVKMCDEQNWTLTMAVYPATATYPDGRTRVIVDYQGRWDFNYMQGVYYNNNRFFFKQSMVEEIRVERDLDGNGSFETILKKYTFGYESNTSKRFFPEVEYEYQQGVKVKGQPTLISITEWGVGGTTFLPSATFSYEGNRLHSANNGYDGRAVFVYEDRAWYETGFEAGGVSEVSNNGWCGGRSRAGDVNTAWWSGQATNYENRFFETDGGTYTWIDEHFPIPIRPGGTYLLRVRAHGSNSTSWIQLGLNDIYGPVVTLPNDVTGSGQWVEAYITLPDNADDVLMMIQGDGWQINEMNVYPQAGHRRVKEKQLYDGLSSQPKVWTYLYDGAATNDPVLSENGALPEENRMGSPYQEYRGNAVVTEVGPNDLATTSWFLQDDVLNGKPVRSMVSLLAFLEPFDVFHTEDWSSQAGSGSVATERTGGDPALKLSNPQIDWNTWANRTTLAINPDEIPAAVFQFKVSDTSTQALLMLERGSEGSGDYRRWGVWVNQGVVYASYSDGGGVQTSNALLGISAETWYLGMLIVDDENMYLRVVNRDDATEAGLFQLATPSGMRNLTWRFKAAASDGTLWLDEYMETKVYSLDETGYEIDLIPSAAYLTLSSPLPISPSGLMPIKTQLVYPNWVFRGDIEDLNSYWSRPIWQKTFLFDGDGTWVATMKEFQYLTDDQNGSQYGNTTRMIESSWNGSEFVPYRAMRMLYFPNTDGVYLTGLPASKSIYQCPGGACSFDNNTLLNSTLYLYDGATNYATSPAEGKLTAQRVLLRWGGGGQSDPRFADMKFGYDSWGNQISVKMYTGEGTSGSLASAGEQETISTYDSAYHAYPVSMTNALNHTTTLQYNYSLGLPVLQTDPNGAVSTITYDSFGRLLTLRKPGDASGTPTLSAVYHDYWTPFTVTLQQKVDAAGGTMEVRRFYDGLGRLVQTQSAASDLAEGERDVVVDMLYDANGKLIRQTVPYSIAKYSGSGNPWRGQNWSQAYTRTDYDPLGRVWRTIGTNGTVTGQFRYDDLDIYSTDAMGRTTHTQTDIWGRPVMVDPPDGPSASYGYDPFDRLTSVLIAGKTTTIEYDLAGRKTGMDDPDMGDWAYAYDALGNLTAQTDARGCVSSLTYDLLNRLTGKNFSGPGQCATTTTVGYGYDQGTNGIGRRTSMTDATGSTAWTYDGRGRMTGQSKTVTGYGTYATAFGYGPADQLLWIRYPGGASGELGEQVDYTYTGQLTLDSVAGSSVYVADTQYDAAGRIDLRTYIPDTLQTDYSYYAWDAPGGAGRLLSITTGPAADPDSLQSLDYTYDVMGNIIRIDDLFGGATQSQYFTYDSLDRLTGARVEGGTLGLYDPQTYTYDDAGRLSSKDGSTYGYQDPDHTHAVTNIDGFQLYWYDANGNQTKRVVGQVTYDLYYNAEGRLVRVDKNNVLWSLYIYDGDGAMVVKTEDGKTTLYIGNLLEIDTTGGGAPVTPTITRTPSKTRTPTATGGTPSAPTNSPSNSPTRTDTRTATATKTKTPTSTVFNGTGLFGEYFNGTNFNNLMVSRIDSYINFFWNTSNPAAGVGVDQFSVRWTGWVRPRFTGDYTFYLDANDGVRLWVNGTQIINNWNTCGNEICNNVSTPISLAAGQWYTIKVEYFENTYTATASLKWSSAQQKKEVIQPNNLMPCLPGAGGICPVPTNTPTSTPTMTPTLGLDAGNGLTAYYWRNNDYSGLGFTKVDHTVDFDWGTGSPDPLIPSDNFSVTWKGYIQPQYTENYSICVYHNDTAQLWFRGQLRFNLTDQNGAEHCAGPFSLTAGQKYFIKLNFADANGAAAAKLYWSSPPQPHSIIPYSRLFPETPAPTPTGTPANGTGLTGQYFSDNGFGSLVYTQTDPIVDFDWDTGGPSGLPADNFSIRWTGFVQPRFSETYTFCVRKNDLARLYVNGQLLFQHTYYETTESCGSIALTAGVKYSITLEFAENSNAANVRLTWQSQTQYKEVIPASQLFPVAGTPTPTVTPTPTPSRTPTHTQTQTSTPQTPSGQVWKTYYYAGSQRVAVRVTSSANPQENGLFYTIGDHLGSTSLVVDSAGNKLGEKRYTPWGETRHQEGNPPTDNGYTGQREEAGIGLYYYNARWYDAQLGRFTQADTIIPDKFSSISYDRYAYVNNNSIKFVDPSGHSNCGPGELNCIPSSQTTTDRAVGWMLYNAYRDNTINEAGTWGEGNECTLGPDCACTVSTAINAAGGKLQIPDGYTSINTNGLKDYLLSKDDNGVARGKIIFDWKSPNWKNEWPKEGKLTQYGDTWENAQKAMVAAGVRAGDLVFYNDVSTNGWDEGTTHVAMVWKVDENGDIWVLDDVRKPHKLEDILGNAKIAEIWIIRPNYDMVAEGDY